MKALQRHQLVWLDGEGWRRVLARGADDPSWDAPARDCLQHWATHDLPLVVTRQPQAAVPGALMLGLAAPARWGRRRLVVATSTDRVRRSGEFAPAAEVTALLPARAQTAWRALCAELHALALPARVHGSYGWQALTGMDCVHARSDIDLLLSCTTAAQADATVALLEGAAEWRPRIDGELVFDDGAAVAWREWAAWRAGRVTQVLVKRLHGAAIESPQRWAPEAA